jgi:hypothetical protein
MWCPAGLPTECRDNPANLFAIADCKSAPHQDSTHDNETNELRCQSEPGRHADPHLAGVDDKVGLACLASVCPKLTHI